MCTLHNPKDDTERICCIIFVRASRRWGREIKIWYELLNKGVWDGRKWPNNGNNSRDQNVWYFGCHITYYYKWNWNGRGCRRTGTDKLDNFEDQHSAMLWNVVCALAERWSTILHALNFNYSSIFRIPMLATTNLFPSMFIWIKIEQ